MAEQAGSSSGPGYELCLNPHYSWLQNFFRVVPFARGYIKREKLRDADILIRRYVSSRLDEAATAVDRARQLLSSLALQGLYAMQPLPSLPQLPMQPAQLSAMQAAPMLVEQLRSLYDRVQRLASDILYADAGWAPVSSPQAIREEEIIGLCEIDDSMIGLAEAAKKLASELEAAAQRGDIAVLQEKLRLLGEAVDKLRAVYEERRRYLQFATTDRTVAKQLREGFQRLRSAVKSLLDTVFQSARSLVGGRSSEEGFNSF